MTEPRSAMRLGAIILGAGASVRMGEPKLLLPWNGSTIIGHLLQIWRSMAQQVAVVCAPSPHPLHGELDRLALPQDARIINPSPQIGMFSSVQSAARWPLWNGALTHFAIVLGDQPQISTHTLTRLLKHVEKNQEQICQPAFQGRPKHPIVLPKAFFEQLAVTTSETLRDFLEPHGPRRSLLETGDEALTFDLDSPADYKAAIARYSELSARSEPSASVQM